jgi:hypothetical protein
MRASGKRSVLRAIRALGDFFIDKGVCSSGCLGVDEGRQADPLCALSGYDIELLGCFRSQAGSICESIPPHSNIVKLECQIAGSTGSQCSLASPMPLSSSSQQISPGARKAE